MQGNCVGEAPSANFPAEHVPLRTLLPGQCLLLADTAVMIVVNSSLWLDNVYIRLTERRDTGTVLSRQDQFLRVEGSGAELWMTNTTLQGNGAGIKDCETCAMDVGDGAKVYAHGVTHTSCCGIYVDLCACQETNDRCIWVKPVTKRGIR